MLHRGHLGAGRFHFMSFKNLPIEKPELLALGQKLGAERIARIVREFYALMHTDILVGFYFTGKDLDLIASRQTSFLLKAFGLTLSYSGAPPSTAHSALPPILEGHFDRRLKILDEHLAREGLSDTERAAWLGFENAFRESVVSR